MRRNKLAITVFTALITILALVTPLSAGNINWTDEPHRFNVSVPTVLPVRIDAHNNAITIEDMFMVNENDRPIIISNISVIEKNGWSLVEQPTSYVGKKEISFEITTDITSIPSREKANILYKAKISPQKDHVFDEAALDVIFTIGWEDTEPIPPESEQPPEIIPPSAPEIGAIYSEGIYEYSYGQANGLNGVNGLWKPIEGQQGWGVRIKENPLPGKIPAPLTKIQGMPVVNYSYLFAYSPIQSLDLRDFDSSLVTDMNNMFYSSQATSIDILNLDTSNVTSFHNMFSYTSALNLDLSNFNTANVTDMSNMFYGSRTHEINVSNFNTSKVISTNNMFAYTEITRIDLSSFDTLNIPDMRTMFWITKITEGFGRTQADCDRLNATTSNPASGIFIPKP